jgi:CRISPR/Cas system-associated exonuclease Cas4 (RecB family)
MEECPRCFWLWEHGLWRRPTGIFPSLPSGMDGILKAHFDRFRDKGILPPELCKTDECKDLKLFDDKVKLNEWRNSRRGLWYQDSEGNILHGGIDNLLVNKASNKFVVLDYKTRGFPLKDDTAGHYQNQLNIYVYLLEKLGHKVEDYAYLLFYHPKEVLEDGKVAFNSDLVKMKVSTADAEKLFRDSLKLLNGECPTKTCPWCEKV